MSYLRKIIAWLVAFATVISLLYVPAFATPGGTYLQKIGFLEWLVGKGSIIYDIVAYSTGIVCSKSEDGYHHANSYQKDNGSGYYLCICSYCGASFTAYEDDLKKSYDNQVDNLPAPGINSAGRLIWQPTLGDLTHAPQFMSSSSWHSSSYLSSSSYDESSTAFSLSFVQQDSIYGFCLKVLFPFSGSFRKLRSSSVKVSGVSTAGNSISYEDSWSEENSFTHRSKGGYLEFHTFPKVSSHSYVKIVYYTPIFEAIPDDALGTEYNPDTRPPSIPGPIGIIGDDGTINQVDNSVKIIDEDNRTIYNPVTNTTYDIDTWNYNYDNRTYDITVDDSTHITVTYGDENITINEGDTIYNIYYITEGSGDDPSPTPGPCLSHDWRESSRVEPGCTSPGRVNYTCSKCGQTKTEALNALGHTWQVERVVNTTYDEDGNVIQQGYTIYQCATCGEQYKDTDSTGPPGPSGPVEDGGLGAFLDNLIKQLLDGLSGAVDLILSFFEKIPRLFGGFLDFLSAMFPYLPEDVIFLFTFGMAAVVFIGVLRWLRR